MRKQTLFPCAVLLAAALTSATLDAAVYNEPGMIAPPVDGRLMFGNGYVLGAFVGPLEMPEKPIYKVHHKLTRNRNRGQKIGVSREWLFMLRAT